MVTNHKAGEFNEARARRYINRALKLSTTTGNPLIFDVLAETPKAMENYLTFITEAAPTTPFLIDSSSYETRLAGVKFASEIGSVKLAIYDSISQKTTEEELDVLRTAGIEAAILLAYTPTILEPNGRLQILNGTKNQEGLLAKAKRANITKPLVDTVALDLAGLSIAAAAMPIVKRKLGLPVGAGSANSIALWRRDKQISPAAKRYLAPALCTYLQCCGANFILAGPIRRAPRFFTAISVTDALFAYANPDGDFPPHAPKMKNHPRYKVL
jgi:tetrahydromethanopterin S-methyltransferase subunit H